MTTPSSSLLSLPYSHTSPPPSHPLFFTSPCPSPPSPPPPVSSELSALQEEGREEQEFADNPILQLDMKVRQQFTECVEVEVIGVLLVQSTLSCEWCMLWTAHFSSLYCRLCGLTQQMQCHIVQPLPAVLCHLTGPPGAGLERVLSVTLLQKTPAGSGLQRGGTFISFASVMCLCCQTACFVHSSV